MTATKEVWDATIKVRTYLIGNTAIFSQEDRPGETLPSSVGRAFHCMTTLPTSLRASRLQVTAPTGCHLPNYLLPLLSRHGFLARALHRLTSMPRRLRARIRARAGVGVEHLTRIGSRYVTLLPAPYTVFINMWYRANRHLLGLLEGDADVATPSTKTRALVRVRSAVVHDRLRHLLDPRLRRSGSQGLLRSTIWQVLFGKWLPACRRPLLQLRHQPGGRRRLRWCRKMTR